VTASPPPQESAVSLGRRRAARALALFLLILGGFLVIRESVQAVRGRESSPLAYPSLWLLGGPQTAALEELAGEVDALLPRDATVMVDTGYPEPERHYIEMWIAWLLPRHRVLPADSTPPPGRPAYRLQVPPRAPRSDDDEMLRNDVGVLVRLGTP
jgi:hypothetical protein